MAPPSTAVVDLITEGTYPFHEGGVSVWCDQIVAGLPETTFWVDSICTTGAEQARWRLTSNTVRRRSLPLWRTIDDPEPARSLDREQFEAVDALIAMSLGELGDESVAVFCALHRLAREGRLGSALLSARAVELTLARLRDHRLGRPVAERREPTVRDAVGALRNLEHMLRPLGTTAAPVRLSHATANGLSVLVAMASMWERGTPMLLTEHGMYLRERYIAMSPRSFGHHERVVVLGFLRELTTTAYRLASAIAPGSDFNRGWELHSGAAAERITTIHNGVERDVFWPPCAVADENTVVWVGRLDPLKDVKTLLRAFATVARRNPEMRLRIFGATPRGNEQYVRECRQLHAELGLGDSAVFEGRVHSVAEAFHSGQIVVSSSISEGFPYSVLEAMASGRAVVATDVGGVAEAVGQAGVLVSPRDHVAMAAAMLALRDDPQRRIRLGNAARLRVAQHFTLDLCLERYRELYGWLGGERGSGASVDDAPCAEAGRWELSA